MLYPTISEYWNSQHQSRAIASYVETVEDMDSEDAEQKLAEASEYNQKLAERGTRFLLTEAQIEEYDRQLVSETTDVMAVVEIPSIQCELPVYHGTDEAVLQVAAGHLEWSSLPVGGESSHCVISGHRGLPSAKLFTNLDEVAEGDLFMIHVLGETLTYQVDQIRIVLPEDTEDLRIEQGKDYCTLMTCTPYGVNSHRLLVRGHRVENVELQTMVTADASRIDPMLVSSALIIGILLIVFIWLLIRLSRDRKKR